MSDISGGFQFFGCLVGYIFFFWVHLYFSLYYSTQSNPHWKATMPQSWKENTLPASGYLIRWAITTFPTDYESDTEMKGDWIQSSRNDVGDQVLPRRSLQVQKQDLVLQYGLGREILFCFPLSRDKKKTSLTSFSWKLLEVSPEYSPSPWLANTGIIKSFRKVTCIPKKATFEITLQWSYFKR